MSYAIRKNKIWLIVVFAAIAMCGTMLGLQRIYAQSDIPQEPLPPGMDASGAMTSAPVAGVAGDATAGGGGGAAVASPTPPEPTVGLHQAINSAISVSSKKSWDGRVFKTLKFKYTTVDGRKLTVVLPAEYKAEKKSRSGWETLFIVYAMDLEFAIDAAERNRPPDVSAFMGQLMAEIRGHGGNRPAPDIISEAVEKANAYLPSMGMGNLSMPMALPGMP